MTISKAEQIKLRRAKVLELWSQGLTQQEIAESLGDVVTQQTISNDIEYIEQESIEFLSNYRKDTAIRYRKVVSSLDQMFRMAWDMLKDPEVQDLENVDTKLDIIHTIQHLGDDIMSMAAAAEPIDWRMQDEIVKSRKAQLEELQKQYGNKNKLKTAF